MELDGTAVHVSSLRGALSGSDDPYGELVRALDWLCGLGVAPAAPSTMAWNLWRQTLTEPVSVGFDAEWGRRALFGGRQEISRPGTFKHMSSVDIVAAYPTAMATRPYALDLAEVATSSRLDPEVCGLALARVSVPIDLPYPPLPIRRTVDMIQWCWGSVVGLWPWCELAAAAELGCRVDVLRCWAPAREADLFGPWWELVRTGRELGGGAARFAKMVLNALWGMFAMRGDNRTMVAWRDDAGTKSYTVAAENRRLPHVRLAHVAAETTARVRTRLLTEGLYGVRGTPVHVDTDGLIVRSSAPLPEPAGELPGEWRRKQKMLRVEVRAPQLFRWWCSLCGEAHADGHYVAAGSTPEQARHLFATTPAGRLQLSWRPGLDTVLPSAHFDDPIEGVKL
jgi:hypothetical protein